MSRPIDAWVRRFADPVDDGAPRLFCLPYAGGSATYYYRFAGPLTGTAEVLAVQYPGRQDRRREPFVENLNRLAELVAGALEPWTDRPYALFGHSMGAVVGFEAARLLDRPPLLLFASGHRAPCRSRPGQASVDDDRALVAELRASGTDPRLLADPDVLQTIVPVLRADYRASAAYRYQRGTRIGAPVVALTGDADPHVTADEAAAWGELTTGPFELRTFAGGHFFLDSWPEAVLDVVRTALARVPVE